MFLFLVNHAEFPIIQSFYFLKIASCELAEVLFKLVLNFFSQKILLFHEKAFTSQRQKMQFSLISSLSKKKTLNQ